jgi:hypothetical protein
MPEAQKAKLGRKPKNIDWESVEAEYRLNQISILEIGRRYGCSDALIRRRAKKEGWSRDLSDETRRKMAMRLIEAKAHEQFAADNPGAAVPDNLGERQLTDLAATRDVHLIREHRADLRRLRSNWEKTMTVLERVLAVIHDRESEEVDGRDLLILGTGRRQDTPGGLLEICTRIQERIIPLERQALGLDQKGGPNTPQGEIHYVAEIPRRNDG